MAFKRADLWLGARTATLKNVGRLYPGAPERTGTPAARARVTTSFVTVSSWVSIHSQDRKSYSSKRKKRAEEGGGWRRRTGGSRRSSGQLKG